ncbi:MAG: tetratricopeptide repeat protein [Deltaproteobacteria bacterium]|nr:tetratricopeptide repeat protein [Deltaproteobacteria bacterium]
MLHAETRRLAAIMFTDIVGFSRQMGADEARMLRLLDVHNQLIQQAVAAHHGTVIKTIGDGFLVDFPSVVHAVQCAQQLHAQLRAHNAEKDKAEQIHVRIGIHSGDIVQRDGDVFGDGVNIASRLQALAEPDTICISDVVYRDVAQKVALGTVVALGHPKLKNIAHRFPVYALLPESPKGVRQTLQVQRLKLSRRVGRVVFVLVSVLLLGGIVAVRHLFLPIPNTPHLAPSTPAALPLPAKPSIVVLPFDNMSKDPEQDYFSNGITEVLTSDLSRLSSLFVIARNTAFTYKGKAVNMHDLRKELGVRYVLEGSVQKAGEQVRIVAQLVDTTTDVHVWSERYDRPLKDIFALQDEIVQQIVTTLKLQLTLEERGYIVRKHTDNLQAYDYFLRGTEYRSRFTKEAHAQARQMYERAVALDPQYAEAKAYLGQIYMLALAWGWSADPQNLERALALAQQALALDDSLPIAHALLSLVYSFKQQNDQAIAEGERAIALDPNNADSYTQQANALSVAGRPEEALPMAEQAMRLNPRYPPIYLATLGYAYNLTGRYAEAIATLKEAISRSPNLQIAHAFLALSYRGPWLSQQSPAGQTLEPALEAAQRALALNDSLHWHHIYLGYIYLYQRQYEQALAEMERAVALAPTEAASYAALAEVLSCMGRTEDALEAAAQALRLKFLTVDAHLGDVGTAYAVAGHYEEARAPLQRYLSHYPNILLGHLMLAAVYSELGQAAEARAEVAEVLRINPQFSLAVHKQRMPIKDPAVLERHLATLRKAGLK